MIKPLSLGLLSLYLLTACSSSKQQDNQSEIYRNTKLDSIPLSVFKNTSIRVFNISPGWVMISPLGYAQASSNSKVNLIPDEICKLEKLEKLELTFQNLRSLPACVYKLNKLRELDLSYNKDFQVKELIDNVREMKALKLLNLLGIQDAVRKRDLILSKVDTTRVQLIITIEDMDRVQSK